MEPSTRGRSPVSAHVAQKLAGDTVVRLPFRPRKDAAYSRNDAAADLDATITTTTYKQDSALDSRPSAPADALSLSGSTPPSSPTMSGFPGAGPKAVTPEKIKAGRPQLVLVDSKGKVAAKEGDDAHFRKHNRGIGSIDSILSSTTCVNTQSECSRTESRLSRDIRIEVEDADCDGASTVPHRHAPDQSVLLPPRDQAAPVPRKGYGYAHARDRLHPAPPRMPTPSSTMTCGAHDDLEDVDEEARLVNEISSWVLRNTLGKDIDDCAAPMLIWDCTSRYIQELCTAAQQGNLGGVQTMSGHGTPSSHGGGTPGPGSTDQQPPAQQGKGKRKADGGGEDGGGAGGRDNQGNEDRDVSPASQAYSTRGSGITNFSCPYRKRNPLRFNVRDYYVCATHSFADMSQLKKHIRAHHPPVQRNAGPFLCPRCCQGFLTKNDLDSHLRRLEVCRLSYDSGGADPEDGITQKIISSLEARSLKAKIDNWVSLWKLLFPSDDVIPDPIFVPVMEIFDFISESKKFIGTLKDLLELQYRHVLEGASHIKDAEFKIRQGLERSTSSIYNWIETVVQDWEQRISGTVSYFTSSAVSQSAASDSWASTPQPLPPSPAPTPTVAPGAGGTANTFPGAGSPDTAAPTAARGTSARRRPNPPPKRIKRAEILPKTQIPPTQIPVPIQRARSPQPQPRISSSSFIPPSRPVLPSQAVLTPSTSAPNLGTGSQYQTAWDASNATIPGGYGVPYSAPGDVFQHPAMSSTQYPPMHPNQLEVQQYLGPEQQTDIATTEAMQRDLEPRPASTSTISTLHASRLMSATPRSSLASGTWIRDENRDSSQTLVEAHPPGRCRDMYCPSCSKTLPEDMTVQHSPVGGIQAVTGPPAPHHHHAFPTVGGGGGGVVGSGPPLATSPGTDEIHGLAETVDWSFHAASAGIHGGHGGNNMFGGGVHGPQEGY